MINNGLDTCPIKKGVIQGGIISPTLFNIFLNDLIIKLKAIDVYIFAYADDIAICGLGK